MVYGCAVGCARWVGIGGFPIAVGTGLVKGREDGWVGCR